jgi:hypothetical protein
MSSPTDNRRVGDGSLEAALQIIGLVTPNVQAEIINMLRIHARRVVASICGVQIVQDGFDLPAKTTVPYDPNDDPPFESQSSVTGDALCELCDEICRELELVGYDSRSSSYGHGYDYCFPSDVSVAEVLCREYYPLIRRAILAFVETLSEGDHGRALGVYLKVQELHGRFIAVQNALSKKFVAKTGVVIWIEKEEDHYGVEEAILSLEEHRVDVSVVTDAAGAIAKMETCDAIGNISILAVVINAEILLGTDISAVTTLCLDNDGGDGDVPIFCYAQHKADRDSINATGARYLDLSSILDCIRKQNDDMQEELSTVDGSLLDHMSAFQAVRDTFITQECQKLASWAESIAKTDEGVAMWKKNETLDPTIERKHRCSVAVVDLLKAAGGMIRGMTDVATPQEAFVTYCSTISFFCNTTAKLCKRELRALDSTDRRGDWRGGVTSLLTKASQQATMKIKRTADAPVGPPFGVQDAFWARLTNIDYVGRHALFKWIEVGGIEEAHRLILGIEPPEDFDETEALDLFLKERQCNERALISVVEKLVAHMRKKLEFELGKLTQDCASGSAAPEPTRAMELVKAFLNAPFEQNFLDPEEMVGDACAAKSLAAAYFKEVTCMAFETIADHLTGDFVSPGTAVVCFATLINKVQQYAFAEWPQYLSTGELHHRVLAGPKRVAAHASELVTYHMFPTQELEHIHKQNLITMSGLPIEERLDCDANADNRYVFAVLVSRSTDHVAMAYVRSVGVSAIRRLPKEFLGVDTVCADRIVIAEVACSQVRARSDICGSLFLTSSAICFSPTTSVDSAAEEDEGVLKKMVVVPLVHITYLLRVGGDRDRFGLEIGSSAVAQSRDRAKCILFEGFAAGTGALRDDMYSRVCNAAKQHGKYLENIEGDSWPEYRQMFGLPANRQLLGKFPCEGCAVTAANECSAPRPGELFLTRGYVCFTTGKGGRGPMRRAQIKLHVSEIAACSKISSNLSSNGIDIRHENGTGLRFFFGLMGRNTAFSALETVHGKVSNSFGG